MILVSPKVVESNPDGTIVVEAICPFCGKANRMTLPEGECRIGMAKLARGVKVQDAFPTWTPAQREFMMTSNCSCTFGSEA